MRVSKALFQHKGCPFGLYFHWPSPLCCCLPPSPSTQRRETTLPHAHRHREHFEKHPAHHATHERMGKICAQLQPVPLGSLKIFGDLSTRETGEKGEREI